MFTLLKCSRGSASPLQSRALGALSLVGTSLFVPQLMAAERAEILAPTTPIEPPLFARPSTRLVKAETVNSGASLDAPLQERTMARVPQGVDAFSAAIESKAMGAAALGTVDTAGSRPALRGPELSAGMRVWGTLLDRVLLQGEAGKDAKGRFVPSAALVARLLGGRKEHWAIGALGRYRTEGFSTLEGEIEGGLLGSFASAHLHLDAGLIAGAGIEEKEADAEALLRLGYDTTSFFRLGAEGRVRHELADERVDQTGEEWDAFAGVQGTFAIDRFFASATVGPQKSRVSSELGLFGQVSVGAIAF